jgi:hypothetical protein
MIPELRAKFNRQWTPERYQAFRTSLDARLGCRVEIAVSETPCFFERQTLDALSQAGADLVEQLLANKDYLAKARATIPEPFRVPNEANRPLFVCADFGLAPSGPQGQLEPRLVEIQGFPSLYAFHPIFARQYVESYGLDPTLTHLLGGLDESGYWRLLREAICAGHDPENVILMEIDPERQKTFPDFAATREKIGVPYVCITRLHKQGNRLFYEGAGGRQIPVHRIYNRVIVDEVVRKNVPVPFDWRDDLQVEWAGHPNWFFLLSKFSIPFFDHPSVPRTLFLDQLAALPDDLDQWVLKPLFSFAGLGVVVGPTREQTDAIPPAERGAYILQQRVDFASVIETPHGPTKAEVRVMYIWLDRLTPVTTIVRMGRGKMMGVDHNKGMAWVGGSVALQPQGQRE